ncbi:hypothetical protein [Undibacterium sp. TJN19]|uniref:hypothetical protein n=1 Tax=Undibacterium sp. TJN19 TaxID=3413055 RepID=UPI003BF181D7
MAIAQIIVQQSVKNIESGILHLPFANHFNVMRILFALSSLTILLSLQACSGAGPSEFAIKAAAAASEQKREGGVLDLSRFDKLDIKNKNCKVSEDQKSADCNFELNGKKYSIKFATTGSGWAYVSDSDVKQ